MKKLLLAIAVLLLPFAVAAQNVFTEFQDGKIWFQVKSDYKINSSLEEDPYHLPLNAIPFLGAIGKNHQLTNLSRPFHAAKNSQALQRTYLLEFADHAAVLAIISELKATAKIEYAERVPLDHSCLTPNDPNYGSQWHLSVVGAATAWNFFSAGSNIRIAIVDNAVDRNHQDLSANLWVNAGETASNGIDDDGNGYIDDINGYDVGDNDNNPNPLNSSWDHGTHCAGIASARTNNSIGIAGMGFSCKLIAVKATTNSASSSSVTNGYDGVIYAVNAGADVISMSWGGTSNSTTAQNVISWASAQGCVLVAAAGNSNVNTQFYPAAYTQCIAVAATNSNDTKASFSNFGSWVDISAPGNNIYSTLPSNGYGNMSGTSMACPLVAGLCGLMLSLNPALTPSDIRTCLSSSAVNINTLNPSYSGQLGAGRIDAAAAMTCISSTLNWPPVAAFTANVTNVTAGGSVTFTDQSVYNPTSWSWSFPGGTPASSTSQFPPPIFYNTAGTYNVSLTVTNANGNDVQTNTNYITVVAGSGCNTINLPVPSGWTGVNYYTGASVGADGWINGMNMYLDKEKAMYYDASASPYTQLVNLYIGFGLAYSTNANKIVNVKVYDGTTGTPGAQIGTTQSLTMGRIMSDVAGGFYTEISFVNAPITLPASKKFFVSVDLTNLQWQAGTHDTLSIVSNSNGETVPSAIWEKQSDNLWYQYNTAGSWTLDASLYIHPFLTSANSVATFTQSTTTICEGESIDFDATGSTYEDTLLWYFPGGTPLTSNTITQSTIYNTAGNYTAILYVVGGGCDLFDSAFVNITVNAAPVLAVNATPGTTICSGSSVTLTASGASTYSWSPGTFLNTTSGATVISTPTSTIQYNVTGTGANGCTSNTSIDIFVNDPPIAVASVNDTDICIGQSVIFDGSNSTSGSSFAWTFTGGSPATSTASSETVTYNTAGTYTGTLIVTNACGSNTAVSQTVTVGCSGIDPLVVTQPSAFYNASSQQLEITLPGTNSFYTLVVYNNLGQVMSQTNSSLATEYVDLSALAAGVYSLQISNGTEVYSVKFVKN
jgi:serine protease